RPSQGSSAAPQSAAYSATSKVHLCSGNGALNPIDIQLIYQIGQIQRRPIMMTERQRQFRENYQSNINPTYNGLLHVCVLYGVGIIAIYYCAQHLIGAGWEWLLVIPVFVAGNFVEWSMHRFVMHRRV